MGQAIDPADVYFASPTFGEVAAFDCDNIPINTWFAKRSVEEHSSFDCRVKHVFLKDYANIVGFYSLNLRLESKQDFGDLGLARLFTYKDKVTTVYLQWLAVRSGYERRGLGTLMMAKIFEDAYHVMTKVGAHALTVRYLNYGSERLYRKSGLIDYGGSGSKQLFIPT